MRSDGSIAPVNPGLLRHRVTIQQKTVTGQDSRGQDVYTWTTFQVAWAQVVALQGREFEAVQQRWADARHKILMQHLAGVKREMRIVVDADGRVFDIVDVEDQFGTRDRLRIYCKELAS